MNKPSAPKQPMSVYTVMLIISTLLMLAACVMMFVELYRYGSPWDKAGAAPRAFVERSASHLALNHPDSLSDLG
ncbi:MAG: hypothetical protein RLY14_2878 [Planctomycetota bacterium]|jgi:hypothetical protein